MINGRYHTTCLFRFLHVLTAWAIMTGVVNFSNPAWGNVEGQNLRSFTLKQIDFLINRVNSGEPFEHETQKIIDKIAENLDILSTYLRGPLTKRDFEKIMDLLDTVVEDWKNAQLMDARKGLLKARTLLASFAF